MTETSSPNVEPQSQAYLHTFLIADIRGYTRFTTEHGDEAAARLATVFARLARETAAAHGGEVIELRGDEVLAVFTSARQALRAAVDLQVRCATTERLDPSLPLRVGAGVDAGEAVQVEQGYRGAALNLAARLCSLAGPREVLTSEAVMHLARQTSGIAYAERGLVELKGFVEPIRVIQVLAETDDFGDQPATAEVQAVASQPPPAIGRFLGALPPGPLVGREDEIPGLISALDSVETGSGQFILFTGEAGIGRTRMAQEAVVLARDRSFLVMTGRCFRSEQHVPLAPFLEAIGMAYQAAPLAVRTGLRRQWPALARLMPDQRGVPITMEVEEHDDGQRAFRAVAGFLAAVAEHAPVALVLDDLQWADAASLRLLQHLARHSRTQRILLVGTFCQAEMAPDSTLDVVLRELTRERLIDRISLRRLAPEATGAIVSGTVGDMEAFGEFADFVQRRTKGNPYLIEEMLRALGGRYRLVRLVGAGGMGRVFEAVDSKSGKVVAAKILFASSEADVDALLRFQQEGALLSTLKHPNIVEVYGTFLDEHTSCIIMEMIEGRSFGQILQEERLHLARIKAIVRQVAAALSYAHARSIIHRDIKPDNIMVQAADRIKVTDFGIARILRAGSTLNTMTGMTLGTPLYMAPEQIEGRPVDGRADIYSLGAVLYQAVTGRPPFDGDDPITLAFHHVHDAPEPPSRIEPDVPADWEALILKALAKEPADRFPNALALERALADLSVESTSSGSIESETATLTRRRANIRMLTPPTVTVGAGESHTEGGQAARRDERALPLITVPRIKNALGRRHRVHAPRRFLLAGGAATVLAIGVLVSGRTLSPKAGASVMGQPVAGWTVHTAASTLNLPQGIAVDFNGIIYIADELDNRIVRLSADGTPLAPWGSAGSGPGQFNHPEAVAVNTRGDVYVADTGNNRVVRLSQDGAPLEQWTKSGSSTFNDPEAIAVDTHGLIYVADSGNARVAVLTPNGSPVTEWPVSSAGQPGKPVAVAVDRHGAVYVVDQLDSVVDKFTSAGKLQRRFGGPGLDAGQLKQPGGVVVDAAGNVLVVDSANRRVQRFSPSGAVLVWPGNLGLSYPSAAALDRSGNVYIDDHNTNSIVKISATGKRMATWTGNIPHHPLLASPSGLASDKDGDIYVADTGHNRILKVAPHGRLLAAWGTKGSLRGQFQGPLGVAVDSRGTIFVADTSNNRIQTLTGTGSASASPASTGTDSAQLSAPYGLTLDSQGDIYAADTGSSQVEVLSPSGAIVRRWGSEGSREGEFAAPGGIAIAPGGRVYVADTSNSRVQAFDSRGHFLFAWGGLGMSRFSSPQSVAVDTWGSVYVADTGHGRVQELTPRGNLLASVRLKQSRSGAPVAPYGIAADPRGDVYVATNDDRVVKIVPER